MTVIRVQSLGQKDPALEMGMATYPRILAWRIPWTEEPSGLQPMGHKESDMTEQLQFLYDCHIMFHLYDVRNSGMCSKPSL